MFGGDPFGGGDPFDDPFFTGGGSSSREGAGAATRSAVRLLGQMMGGGSLWEEASATRPSVAWAWRWERVLRR